MAWVEEDGTQLPRCRRIFGHRQARVPSRGVMIVHRNPKVTALEVMICGVNSKSLTIPPRNLEDIQGNGNAITRAGLTDELLRGGSDGAAIARSAHKPKEIKVVRA